VISLEEFINVNLDSNSSRVDSICSMENLNQEDLGNYITEFLLPGLQRNYNYAKDYLPNKTRKNIYNIQKYLADLIDDQEFVKLSTNSDNDSANYSKYESLFLLIENINRIYFFSIIVKSKLKGPLSHYSVALRNIMRLTQEVHKEICNIANSSQDKIII